MNDSPLDANLDAILPAMTVRQMLILVEAKIIAPLRISLADVAEKYREATDEVHRGLARMQTARASWTADAIALCEDLAKRPPGDLSAPRKTAYQQACREIADRLRATGPRLNS